MPRLSLSTWSIHRSLRIGYGPADGGIGRLVPDQDEPGSHSLLAVPSRMAAHGANTLEICHFHFPSTDQSYLDELRTSLDESGVELFSILVDAGDITAEDMTQRDADLDWIRDWLDVAGGCGASHARIIAGQTDVEGTAHGDWRDHPVIRMSADHLKMLAAYGQDCGVQVITENFRALTKRPEQVLAILDLCEEQVGLCADFGNYGGPTKYDDLTAILPYADAIHAKPEYQNGIMDRTDFNRCLDLSRDARFDGPYSLIFEGSSGEWDHLNEIRDVVKAYV